MCVNIWEPTQLGINNLTYNILILDYPCDTDFTNDVLYIKMTFQNYDKVDGDRPISTSKTYYENYKGPLGLVFTDFAKSIFKATNCM